LSTSFVFSSSSFFSSGALTTGADPKLKPPKLKAGLGGASVFSPPPMTKVEGGVFAVPPNIEGTSLFGGGVAVPKTGGLATAGAAGFVGVAVDDVPKIDVDADAGVPKIGVDVFGVEEDNDSGAAVPLVNGSEVPNLIGPPETGVEDFEDAVELAAVPKVKPEVPPEVPNVGPPEDAGMPNVGVLEDPGMPKVGVLAAGDAVVPKVNPPPEIEADAVADVVVVEGSLLPKVIPPEMSLDNLDDKLEGAAAASLSAFGFGVLQQGQAATSPPLRV